MIAFDADVLIYAADPTSDRGRRTRSLLEACAEGEAVGSVLLLPEMLSKPLRSDPKSDVVSVLATILGRLTLVAIDEPTARLAAILGARYKLRAADATHLATAVACGADRFVTNNRKDFPSSITEVDVVYPGDLPTA